MYSLTVALLPVIVVAPITFTNGAFGFWFQSAKWVRAKIAHHSLAFATAARRPNRYHARLETRVIATLFIVIHFTHPAILPHFSE